MIMRTDDQWQAIQQDVATLRHQITDLATRLTAAPQRIAELAAKKTQPLALVKANQRRRRLGGAPAPGGARPIRVIQQRPASVREVQLSVGASSDLLRRLARGRAHRVYLGAGVGHRRQYVEYYRSRANAVITPTLDPAIPQTTIRRSVASGR